MNETVRRTLVMLSAAFALGFAAASMTAGPGSAALVALSGNASLAGLYVALLNVGAAVGAAIGGRAMDRWGRRPVLIAGYSLGAAGYTIAGFGVTLEILALFITGVLTLAVALGIGGLTRVAAAEMFPPSERGRGIAWLQTSAIAGAVAGPLFLMLTEPLGHAIGRDALGLVWWIAPLLVIAGAVTLRRAAEPMEIAKEIERAHPHPSSATSSGGAVRSGRLLVAGVVALAASHAAMASVMGVAGVAVVHAGHGAGVLGTVMMLHFVGMYGLSRIVGHATDRWGRRPTILIGLVLLAVGGGVVALFPGMGGLAAGLLIVGLGWSFGYIGASVLLTDITVPSRRARILGRADLITQLTAAVIATSGGVWFAENGLEGLGLAAIGVVTVPFVAFLFVAEPFPGQYHATRETAAT
ncbi:MAG TPA: MFS transporter [Gemmatimonadaceae bacterium]|nr:MFS transporter [Gemmatimonadaceae bacterium]